MNYSGKIFQITLPCDDPSPRKTTQALALGKPDADGEIEFLCIRTLRDRPAGKILDLAGEAVVSGALIADAALCLDKCYPLAKNVIIKELASVSEAFLEKSVA